MPLNFVPYTGKRPGLKGATGVIRYVGGHAVFFEKSSYLKFKGIGADLGGLVFTFNVPKFLVRKIPASSSVKVKTLPMNIYGANRGKGDEADLKTPEAYADWLMDAFNTASDEGGVQQRFLEDAINSIDKTSQETLNKLKVAFRENLSNSMNRGISESRRARRNVFRALSRYKEPQLTGDDPYDAGIFNDAIDNFTYERVNVEGDKKIMIQFKIPMTSTRMHPDLGGGPSAFRGRDQIAFSILGQQFKGGNRKTTNGKRMIVPVISTSKDIEVLDSAGRVMWTKRSMAVIDSVGNFKYLTKKNQNLEGIPVNFSDRGGINAKSVFIQDPSNVDKRRIVFWGQVHDKLYFPENVHNILINSGMAGSAV